MIGSAGPLALSLGALVAPTGPSQGGAPEWTYAERPAVSDLFGDWVASAGDLDRDGIDDLMIGGRSTWLFSGSDGSLLHVMEAGYPAGDVDRDGLTDLARVDRGRRGPRVTLLSVREGAELWSSELGSPMHPVPSPWSDLRFQIREVVGVGDVDADGCPDLAAKAFGGDRVGVVLFSGRTGWSARWILGDDEVGAAAAVAGIGDVDGDGCADLAVARALLGGSTSSGEAAHSGAVYSGATRKLLYAVELERTGAQANAVAPAGDHDGDGCPDWLLGVSVRPSGDSHVLVVSGASGTVLRSVEVGGGDLFSITALDDLDGDRTREFAVGSRWLFDGMTTVHSSATGETLERFMGEIPHRYLGWSLTEVGDLDGDGVRELLIGATNPWSHPLAGYAEVRSLCDGTLLRRLRAP